MSSPTSTHAAPAAKSLTRKPCSVQRKCSDCEKKKKNAPPPLKHEVLGRASGLQAKGDVGRSDDPLEH
ncbi:MAG: hypothetical protein ABI588_08490, partial [Arenimonas sp.]